MNRKQKYWSSPKGKATAKAWQLANAALIRHKTLMRKFDLTLAQYDEMLEAQNGVCKICSHPNPHGHRLAVDHNHLTGEIRGLLCAECNTAIARVEAVPGWCQRAETYLQTSDSP